MSHLRLLAAWAALFALYLLFAGQTGAVEAGTGAAAAGFATALFVGRPREGRRRLAVVPAPWPRVVLRPMAALLPDAWTVGRVLLGTFWRRRAGERGLRQCQPFRHGADEAAAAGRRALVTLAVSLTPNGIVLDLPRDEDTLLVHRMRPIADRADHAWPV